MKPSKDLKWVCFSHAAGATRVHRLQGGGGLLKGKFLALTFCGLSLETSKVLVPCHLSAVTTCLACRRAMNASLGKELP